MKLIIASEGFYTEEIVAKCEELVGKTRDKINIAVINEGYAVQRDNLRWVLVNLNDAAKNFGGKLELVNLLAFDLETIKKRIDETDVIFVVGGQSDYLMSVFNKTGFAKLLPELLKTKVYVGSSAGSMVMGKRLSTFAYEKIFNEPSRQEYGIDNFLGYVDLCFLPHLDSKEFPHNQKTLREVTKDHTGPDVYSLHDDSAIVIVGEIMTTIGSEPLITKGNLKI